MVPLNPKPCTLLYGHQDDYGCAHRGAAFRIHGFRSDNTAFRRLGLRIRFHP